MRRLVAVPDDEAGLGWSLMGQSGAGGAGGMASMAGRIAALSRMCFMRCGRRSAVCGTPSGQAAVHTGQRARNKTDDAKKSADRHETRKQRE